VIITVFPHPNDALRQSSYLHGHEKWSNNQSSLYSHLFIDNIQNETKVDQFMWVLEIDKLKFQKDSKGAGFIPVNFI
jgi:hypothetical protein